jgi:bifunctional non-homologous end joining protein LigD
MDFARLAYVGEHETRLISRKNNVYSFTSLAAAIHIDLDWQAVLDGEIVILAPEGRPQFYELLRRRGSGEAVFFAFDLLWLDGEDPRERPLIERKQLLLSLVPARPSVLLYADHIDRDGVEFFRLTCEERSARHRREVEKRALWREWFKIRNRGYSQREGRRELFEKKRGGVRA